MSLPLTNISSDEVILSSNLSQERFTCILLMFALCVHPRASRAALFWANCNFPKFLFVAPDHTTEQQSRCDKTRTCRTCLVDSAVNKVEQHFIMDRLLPRLLLYQYVLTITVTPSSLVTSTCSIFTWFITRCSWGLVFSEWFVPNTMFLVFEIFRNNLFRSTHSEADCSCLLSVAVISIAVVADVYSVEHT